MQAHLSMHGVEDGDQKFTDTLNYASCDYTQTYLRKKSGQAEGLGDGRGTFLIPALTEAGGSPSLSQPGLHSDFQDS